MKPDLHITETKTARLMLEQKEKHENNLVSQH